MERKEREDIADMAGACFPERFYDGFDGAAQE